MEASEFDRILNQILSSFEVRYVDFDNPEFRPYKDRKIGGVVRIDTGEILMDYIKFLGTAGAIEETHF